MNTSRGDDQDPPLDPERLALLLEGRLPEAEREQLLARLAASPEELAVFADAAAAAREVEAVAAPAEATRRRVPTRYLLAIAAGLVAIAIVPQLIERNGGSGADAIGEYVAMLGDDAAIPQGFDLSPWSGTRSAVDPSTAPTPVRALPWRIGARLVDIEVAAETGDSVLTSRLGRELAAQLESAGVGAATRSVYLDAGALLRDARGDNARLREGRSEVEEQLGDERVALGAWIEAARLAAAGRRAAFFSSEESSAAASRLREMGMLTPAASALVSQVSQSRDFPEQEWQELAERLGELLASF